MSRLPGLGFHLSSALDARRTLDLAKASEAAGLHSVWLAEDLFFRGAFARAGAIAAATDRIQIGLGVLTPYVRHPAVAAMEIAALHELAPGRVVAGYGAGVRARTERLGHPHEPPTLVVRETVDALRRLLAGAEVDADARTFRARGLTLDAPPGVVPIYVAAMGPRALRQAGEIADGVVLTLMASDVNLRAAAELVREGAKAAGREAPPLVAYMAAAIDGNANAAVDRLRPLFARYLRRWMPIAALGSLFAESGVMTITELRSLAGALDDGSARDGDIPEELVRAHAVVGTPAQARARLAALTDIGVAVVGLEPGLVPDAQDQLIEQMGRLGSADVARG